MKKSVLSHRQEDNLTLSFLNLRYDPHPSLHHQPLLSGIPLQDPEKINQIQLTGLDSNFSNIDQQRIHTSLVSPVGCLFIFLWPLSSEQETQSITFCVLIFKKVQEMDYGKSHVQGSHQCLLLCSSDCSKLLFFGQRCTTFLVLCIPGQIFPFLPSSYGSHQGVSWKNAEEVKLFR